MLVPSTVESASYSGTHIGSYRETPNAHTSSVALLEHNGVIWSTGQQRKQDSKDDNSSGNRAVGRVVVGISLAGGKPN